MMLNVLIMGSHMFFMPSLLSLQEFYQQFLRDDAYTLPANHSRHTVSLSAACRCIYKQKDDAYTLPQTTEYSSPVL